MRQPQEGERWRSRTDLTTEVEITGTSNANGHDIVTFTKDGYAKEFWNLGEFLRHYEVVA